MTYIDVHCHLEMIEKDMGEIIGNADKKDVKIIVANSVGKESNMKVLELAKKYGSVKAALGLYPIDALKLKDNEITKILGDIEENKDKIVAIGEVGLDFKESDEKKKQIDLFERIVRLSIDIDKPIIVHSRKAENECIEILDKLKAKKVIMHCFSGNFNLVKKIIDSKWYLTIPTSVKNSEHFQKIIKECPIKQLLCETDSPYLHPDKDFPNTPDNVIESYKKIAEIKRISLKEVEKTIESNYKKLFAS